MSQQKWERDVLNRQRNIVFPDTMLNQGRFYRNIASGKAVFSTGLRVSLLMVVALFVVVHVVDVASTFAGRFDVDGPPSRTWKIGPSLISLVWLLFWVFLTVKALFPPPQPVRKRRRGYRSSSSNWS